MKNSSKKKMRNPWLIFKSWKRPVQVLIVLGVVALGWVGIQRLTNQMPAEESMEEFPMVYQEVAVERGEVKRTIYVTGNALAEQEQVLAGVPGKILSKVNVQEGDRVQAGDIIYEIDDTEARLKYQLQLLEYERMVQESKVNPASGVAIRSDNAGEIVSLDIAVGSEVTPDTVVATIENKALLEVRNALSINDYGLFQEGEVVQVLFPQFMSFLEGTIRKIDGVNTPTPGGGLIRYVTVEIVNPGGITEGQTAKIQTQKGERVVSAMQGAPVEYAQTEMVEAGIRGTIASLEVATGDMISQGTILAKVDAASYELGTLETKLLLQEKKLALEETKKNLDQYVARAEFDGTVIELNVKEGEAIPNDLNAAVIANVDNLIMRVIIDEYDIGQVYVGQMAEVYFTAFGNESFPGVVSQVGQRGVMENGSVNFRASVSIKGNDRIRAGMSGDADVFVENKEDVLRVPREAITLLDEGLGIVQILGSEGLPEPKEVVTGSEGDYFVEIVSGLVEGDLIVLFSGGQGQNFATKEIMY